MQPPTRELSPMAFLAGVASTRATTPPPPDAPNDNVIPAQAGIHVTLPPWRALDLSLRRPSSRSPSPHFPPTPSAPPRCCPTPRSRPPPPPSPPGSPPSADR